MGKKKMCCSKRLRERYNVKWEKDRPALKLHCEWNKRCVISNQTTQRRRQTSTTTKSWLPKRVSPSGNTDGPIIPTKKKLVLTKFIPKRHTHITNYVKFWVFCLALSHTYRISSRTHTHIRTQVSTNITNLLSVCEELNKYSGFLLSL